MSEVNSDLILVASCSMEAPWLLTVLNMLKAIPQQCPIIKDLIMDVSVGHELKGLPYLHLTLWLLEMCVMQTGVSFLSLPGSGGGHLHQRSASSVEGMGRGRSTKQCHICP